MTDIHTHILPCVDDGSPSVEKSLTMLEKEAENGITRVVLTPHLRERFNASAAQLKQAFDEFNALKNERGVPVELFLGQELYYDNDLLFKVQNGEALTLAGGKYVLLEFSTVKYCEVTEAVYKFLKAGYIPVVAHLERYGYLTYADAYEIKELGGLIQVNAESVYGKNRAVKIATRNLFRSGLVDFVASDCHCFRENYMAKAYGVVKRKYGEEVARKVFADNANAIIEAAR